MTITPTRNGYQKPDGTLITLNAQQVISKLHPHPTTYRRDPAIRVGVAKAATLLAATPSGPMPPAGTLKQGGHFSGNTTAATVVAVMAHKFWQRITVLEAPSHCIDHRDRAACSIDLLARTDKGELLVASVHTAPYETLNHEALASELGAAIVMIGYARREIIPHAMVICATAGTCTLHCIPEYSCTYNWLEDLHNYPWLRTKLGAD